MLNVYVIMPVGADPSYSAKRKVLGHVARKLGVSLHLPLENSTSHQSPSDVLEEIRRSDLVIADLSLERPSCYFETGLAQALGKRTRLIAAAGTDVHQVFGRDRVRFYEGSLEYQEMITSILNAVRSELALSGTV